MKTNNSPIQEIFEKKGDLSIASLTVNEFKSLIRYLISDEALIEDEEELLSINEVVSKLNTSKSTFYRERAKGRIPEYILGRKPKFKLSEVKKSLKINTP